MKNKILLVVFSVMILTTLVLTACGSPAQQFPTGTFTKVGSELGSVPYGLIFNEDGTFLVFEGDSTLVEATYSVEGDVFTETGNNAGCASPVDFKYTFDGKTLTFNYVGDPADDSCGGRQADFNNQSYVLSK